MDLDAAFLRSEDPRARLLIGLGDEICPDDELYKIVKVLREITPDILKERLPKIRKPISNVDLGSGIFPFRRFRKPDYYTTFFGWARVAGICAQILDERNSRDGRGTPIYRPKYIPKNQPFREIRLVASYGSQNVFNVAMVILSPLSLTIFATASTSLPSAPASATKFHEMQFHVSSLDTYSCQDS